MQTSLVEAIQSMDSEERGITFGADGEFVSFADLRERSLVGAEVLWEQGVRTGDRLLISSKTQKAFVMSFLSAICLGAIPVPTVSISPVVNWSEYLRRIQEDMLEAEAAGLVVDVAMVGEVERKCPSVRVGSVPTEMVLGSPKHREFGHIDPVYLQPTSGSTGGRRLVMNSQQGIMANARAIIDRLDIGAEDRLVSWLPFYHDMGLIGFLIVPIIAQVSLHLIPMERFARRPLSWCQTMSDVKGTISFGPNFAYERIASRCDPSEAAAIDLTSWRVAGCGSEMIHRSTIDRVCAALKCAGLSRSAFLPAYGLAEMGLAVTMGVPGEGARYVDLDGRRLERVGEIRTVNAYEDVDVRSVVSCGKALDGISLAVRDSEGVIHTEEEVWGEVLLKGPSRMLGYFGSGDQFNGNDHNGWLCTGDLGFVKGGELYVTGRFKERIVVDGRCISAETLERVAGCAQGVNGEAVAAIGVEWAGSERVVILAEVLRGAEPERVADQIVRLIRQRCGVAGARAVIVAKREILRTSSGKVRRSELKARFVEGRLRIR